MYVLVNIGCLECGVSSAIVGVFASKEYAESLIPDLDKSYNWREGGQNVFEVFELPQAEMISPLYGDLT